MQRPRAAAARAISQNAREKGKGERKREKAAVRIIGQVKQPILFSIENTLYSGPNIYRVYTRACARAQRQFEFPGARARRAIAGITDQAARDKTRPLFYCCRIFCCSPRVCAIMHIWSYRYIVYVTLEVRVCYIAKYNTVLQM